MARLRSREAETEDVNQRRLQRGAVKRTHLTRWAVGSDELAPGIVGETHLHPTTIEVIRDTSASSGVGQLLVVEASAQSFASGGAYVTADSIVYQHGFEEVTAAGSSIVWPVDAVGEIQVELAWDTYKGGGTVEIEVNGAVPAWGLLASGSTGQVGCKRRSVHIAEGSVVKVKVTQSSGSAKTGDVHVEFSIPDPSLIVEPEAPIELPDGVKVWWRGETLAATLPDGDPVTSWPDISGNGYHQSTHAGNPPTFRAAVLNGRGVVEFDGTNDGMKTDSSTVTMQGNAPTTPRDGYGWTVMAVFQADTTTAGQLIVNGDDQTNAPGTTRASQYLIVGTSLSTLRPGITADSSGETVVAGTWHIAEAWRNDTEYEALLDGVGNGATAIASSFETGNGIYLGKFPQGAGSQWFDGKVAEIIGWGRALSATERAVVRAYFAQEYDI